VEESFKEKEEFSGDSFFGVWSASGVQWIGCYCVDTDLWGGDGQNVKEIMLTWCIESSNREDYISSC
jgi:hypothetical protein